MVRRPGFHLRSLLAHGQRGLTRTRTERIHSEYPMKLTLVQSYTQVCGGGPGRRKHPSRQAFSLGPLKLIDGYLALPQAVGDQLTFWDHRAAGGSTCLGPPPASGLGCGGIRDSDLLRSSRGLGRRPQAPWEEDRAMNEVLLLYSPGVGSVHVVRVQEKRLTDGTLPPRRTDPTPVGGPPSGSRQKHYWCQRIRQNHNRRNSKRCIAIGHTDGS